MLKFIASLSFVLLFAFGGHAFAFAQTLPANVKSTFEQKFAGAKVISCHEINGEHNIIFQQENEVKSARFDASGKWIDTIISLNPGTAPAKIEEYISANHAGKNGHIRRIENEAGTTFLAFISETKALRFDKDGNMTKEEDVSSIDEAALSTIK
ncbi:PepSY-like domain-containing protein [Bernardetia sp. Wsw4-3y2]|uniref:PepSY-like domain-containing protein n=1 Tax=unclassified Bernardetia TaxID=2647129 RepID=UPI0030CB8B18